MLRDLILDIYPVVTVFVHLQLTGKRFGKFLQTGEAQAVGEGVIDHDLFALSLTFLKNSSVLFTSSGVTVELLRVTLIFL